MENQHPKLIRNGNHFIKVPNIDKWIVIDGPWFQRFMIYSQNASVTRVQIPVWELLPAVDNIPASFEPVYFEAEIMTWTVIRYYSGDMLTERMMKKPHHWPLWVKHASQRVHVGWFLEPDGRIPAYYNHVDFIERYSDHMMCEGIWGR